MPVPEKAAIMVASLLESRDESAWQNVWPPSYWFSPLPLYFCPLQVAKEFILKSEQDGFIRRIHDIIHRVETLLRKDDPSKDQGALGSPEIQSLTSPLMSDSLSVRVRGMESSGPG